MARVRIKLDPNAEAEFKKLGREFIADDVLPQIVDAAQRIVPYESGDLHDSIHAESDAEGDYVVADEDYAAHVELGTSKMPAQPYLRPALNTKIG